MSPAEPARPEDRPSPHRFTSFRAGALRRVMATLFSIHRDPGGDRSRTVSHQLHCADAYFDGVLAVLLSDPDRSDALRAAVSGVRSRGGASDFIRLQNVLDREAGCEEETEPEKLSSAGTANLIPIVIYLDNVRSPFNVGNIIRSAAAFGVVGVVLSPGCPDMEHSRLQRAAMGSTGLVRCVRGSLVEARMLLGGTSTVYALETCGAPLEDTRIVTPAIIVVGHEEYGVSEELLREARGDGGVVSIRQAGSKRSLNVGVATGVVLYCATQAHER